jgi:hypothetical protein
MRSAVLVGTALAIAIVAGAAHADAPPSAAESNAGRIAGDVTLGAGGGVAFIADRNTELNMADGVYTWLQSALGFGLGWQRANSRIAVMGRTKAMLGTRNENGWVASAFVGGGARIRLGANTAFHVALGGRAGMFSNGEHFPEFTDLAALLRVERFDGPVAFGLEATPHIVGEDRSSQNYARVFDLTFTMAIRR